MSPFTGKELLPETWLKRPRRVIAFKIDNNINARPQSGLQEADAVHEILVEGGMTRFLAFFYDNTSKYLGPIRSARPTDPTVIRPYGGTLVVSGATAGLIPSIRELGVFVLEEQSSPVMFRISSREAPHNLYADTEFVRERIDELGFYFLQPGPGPIYPVLVAVASPASISACIGGKARQPQPSCSTPKDEAAKFKFSTKHPLLTWNISSFTLFGTTVTNLKSCPDTETSVLSPTGLFSK